MKTRKGAARKATTRSEKKTATIYQLKITLLRTKPPIWRRIQVEDCTLKELHQCIQAAMGWYDCHLHMFVIGGADYGDPEAMEGDVDEDASRTKLSDIVPPDGSRFRFRYEYDFGDSWEHEIVVEKILEGEPGKKYPVCVDGARACPPEDCGGVYGYQRFLEIIRNPKHSEHEEMLEWAGGEFDPEEFDPKEAM